MSRTALHQTPREAERITERRDDRHLERPSNSYLSADGKFSLDLSRIPPGYTMEFKRHKVFGAEDKHNQVEVRRFHWEPVPHKMQPHFLGHLAKDENEHIIIGDLGLYMRPTYLCEEAAKEATDITDYQLNQQLQSLRLSSKDQVGEKNTRITKKTIAVPQPVE